MKELPKNPPTNPAAEAEPKQPDRANDLESAIDRETGGLLHSDRDDKRTDKRPDEKPAGH